MSISNAHSEAARQNGKLSQGPVTPEGKSRSSQNARKHNLLCSTALLSCEDRAELDALAEGFLNEYQPETPTENRYVREMIDAEFRLQRVRAHAASIQEARMRKLSETPTSDDAAEAFRQLAEEGPSLTLLLRYENQFRGQFDKSLKLLLDLRLRANTDKDKIMRAHADAYNQFTKDLVDLPMPSKPAPTEAESEPQPAPPAHPPQAAKSNEINFPKEPSTPKPPTAAPAAKPTELYTGQRFGHYFGNFGR